MELAGKTAVVTGASSGIGRAVAGRLAEEGMTVVAVARRKERLDELAAEFPSVLAYPADVTNDDDVAGLRAWVGEHLGACHVLVNNAGAVLRRRLRGPHDVDDVLALMDLNFGGTVRCTAALADLLVASAPSRVINVASVAGRLAPVPPAYAASKFAVVGLSESLRGDWGRRGVAVCNVDPGFVVTEGFPQDRLLRSPIGRRVLVDVDDVAAAIADVARKGTPERTVPRWYRVAVFARHVVPFWYRALLRRS